MPRPVKKTVPVWRFVDYQSRWGMQVKADQKIKVPQFVKLYVNGWDGPGGDVLTALMMLERSKNSVWLQGALWSLLRIVSNTSPKYQGYIVNSRKMPATNIEVGSMLRVDGRRALAALKKLEEAGFLEHVSVPVRFFGEKEDMSLPQSPAVTTSKKGVNDGKKPRGQPKNAGPPFKRESNRKREMKKQKNRDCETQGKQVTRGVDPALQPRKAGESQEQYVERRRQGLLAQLSNTTATASPTATPTMITAIDSATNRDAGGPCHQSSRTAPHVHSQASESIGNVIKLNRLNRSRYSEEAWKVANEVMKTIGYVATNRPAFANEEARWAKAWDDLRELPDDVLCEIKRKLLDKARSIAANRCGYKSPEAYLRTSLTNLVKDEKRRLRYLA